MNDEPTTLTFKIEHGQVRIFTNDRQSSRDIADRFESLSVKIIFDHDGNPSLGNVSFITRLFTFVSSLQWFNPTIE